MDYRKMRAEEKERKAKRTEQPKQVPPRINDKMLIFIPAGLSSEERAKRREKFLERYYKN